MLNKLEYMYDFLKNSGLDLEASYLSILIKTAGKVDDIAEILSEKFPNEHIGKVMSYSKNFHKSVSKSHDDPVNLARELTEGLENLSDLPNITPKEAKYKDVLSEDLISYFQKHSLATDHYQWVMRSLLDESFVDEAIGDDGSVYYHFNDFNPNGEGVKPLIIVSCANYFSRFGVEMTRIMGHYEGGFFDSEDAGNYGDLNRYKTFREADRAIRYYEKDDNYEREEEDRSYYNNCIRGPSHKDIKLVYESDNFKVSFPNSKIAAQVLSEGTNWCIAYPGDSSYYESSGVGAGKLLFIVRTKEDSNVYNINPIMDFICLSAKTNRGDFSISYGDMASVDKGNNDLIESKVSSHFGSEYQDITSAILKYCKNFNIEDYEFDYDDTGWYSNALDTMTYGIWNLKDTEKYGGDYKYVADKAIRDLSWTYADDSGNTKTYYHNGVEFFLLGLHLDPKYKDKTEDAIKGLELRDVIRCKLYKEEGLYLMVEKFIIKELDVLELKLKSDVRVSGYDLRSFSIIQKDLDFEFGELYKLKDRVKSLNERAKVVGDAQDAEDASR